MNKLFRSAAPIFLFFLFAWTNSKPVSPASLNAETETAGPGLLPLKFQKLPVTAFTPSGWLKRQLELQRDGLTGHLGEISIWLVKSDNAWLNKEGKGKYGWEELPYWLKGYGNIGYMLRDTAMIRETKFWIEAVLRNQRPDGDFGPMVLKKGNRDLWTNMPMLWCLQSYYEYSGDRRVIALMQKYFRYELSVPDNRFLEDYWENSRGGDNMLSVYWLYEKTHEPWLLDLATKIDRNTADWRQKNNLPNWHNVNIAQCFREPATYYRQSHLPGDLEATYSDFRLVREKYGQVPGGMWGGDENSRPGYDDPRQAVETCGMVEQMTSDQFLLQITGDASWADNCEDVAFNTFPAAFMPDFRSLRYLTAPNMVMSDSSNHSPGIANEGPFLMMNPFSSRCCQHNHAAGWVYFAENSWMATPDGGLVALLYAPGTISAKVKGGNSVSFATETRYPFESQISYKVTASKPAAFPLYLRIPAWCPAPAFQLNGATLTPDRIENGYAVFNRTWTGGETLSLDFPMKLNLRTWTKNKNSVSVDYGPLTYSLRISERLQQVDSRLAAVQDARWQPNADPARWPSFEIYPASAWNYGLIADSANPGSGFRVEHKSWPADNNPFADSAAPIAIMAKGKAIPDWKIDRYGLCDTLPQSPVSSGEPETALELVPMGSTRLRISAFPVIAAKN